MKPDRKSLIKKSTIEFWKEGKRKPGYSFFEWLHGYVYGRWPYLYIGMGTGRHPLARIFGRPIIRLANWLILRFGKEQPAEGQPSDGQERVTFADTYHGKVVPLEAAKELVMINEEINLPDLEKIIPYTRAREIVMKNPDHIVVLDCPCRVSRENPCMPLDVCLIVGEPFASFVLDHHPDRSRPITQEEAAQIIKEEDERGHVHHAFFKDAMLGRFYAICNCCSCCCGAMLAHQKGTPMLASSGYVARVDRELCIACGTCADSCQFGALSIGDGAIAVDEAACMGCGVCVGHCEQDALELVREASKGEPLEIQKLMAQVM